MIRPSSVKPLVIGFAGTTITEEEKYYINQINPLGFILFKRNVQNPDQVQTLCATLRSLSTHDFCLILIDQEGGRVSRLDWWQRPPMAFWGQAYQQENASVSNALYDTGYSLAHHLKSLGINVNCAPVLDLTFPHTHQVIGDRSFGSEPTIVRHLGEAYAQGLLDGGVLPVMKHLPGHGHATIDSHDALPSVTATQKELQQSDFIPFMKSSIPMGMTAHILFKSIDSDQPATLSPIIIKTIIRDNLQFDGFLWSDDLAMGALKNIPLEQRFILALQAGCDATLYCDPDLQTLARIAPNLPSISEQSWQRLLTAWDHLQ